MFDSGATHFCLTSENPNRQDVIINLWLLDRKCDVYLNHSEKVSTPASYSLTLREEYILSTYFTAIVRGLLKFII